MRRALADRLWSKVDKSGECWIWTASRSVLGYGQIGSGGRRGPPLRSHRVAWAVTNGPIPKGMLVLHRCDNPPCCNPAHLFLGTHADNMRDMATKGRSNGSRDGRPGETHPMAKLTDAEVREIRRRYVKKYGAVVSLAREFNVSETAIRDVVSGRHWRHVA